MLQIELEAKHSADCATLVLTDKTAYEGVWGRENITCRNVSVEDYSGNVLLGSGETESVCATITNSYRFEWSMPSTAEFQLTSFIVNGVERATGATYATLGDLVSFLNGLNVGTFSLSLSIISVVSSTNTYSAMIGLNDGTPPTVPFAVNPFIGVELFQDGTAFQVGICNRYISYTALATDIEFPIGGQSTAQAVSETAKNIFAGLYAEYKKIAEDIKCDCGIEVTLSDCECQFKIVSTKPNVPVTGVTVSSTASGAISLSTPAQTDCNWDFKRKYVYDLSGLGDPQANLEATTLLVDGANVVSVPTGISGGSRADQIVSLANILNGFGVGNFSATPLTLICLSAKSVEGLVLTSGVTTFSITPTSEISYIPADDTIEVPITKDGVYCAHMTVLGNSPEYAQASIQLPPILPNDALISIDIDGFPIPFSPFVIGYTGSAISMAKAIADQFNKVIVNIYELTTVDAYAYALGNKVSFYVSIPFLQRYNGSAACGTTGLDLVVSLTGTGDPTLMPSGTELSFDVLSCIQARSFSFYDKKCFAVTCRFMCCLATIALREYDTGSQMPDSMRILARLQAVEQRMCVGDLSGAQSIIYDLSNLPTPCSGCGGHVTNAVPGPSVIKTPCGCS